MPYSDLCCVDGPHGVPAPSSAQQASAGFGDEQTIVDMTGQPDTSLEGAGFTGTVTEAYASFDYV